MNVETLVNESILLGHNEILEKFTNGQFPDKTFSKLYARWLDIKILPGIILEIKDNSIINTYAITPDIDDLLEIHDSYVFLYDFRTRFHGLKQWMKERNTRPKPTHCGRREIGTHLKKIIDTGSQFMNHYFIAVNQYSPDLPFAASTINQHLTYIEYANSFKAIEGLRSTKLSILRGTTPLLNETGFSTDCLIKITAATKKITDVIGDNTTCEFFIIDEEPYLVTGQKRSAKDVPFSVPDSGKMRIISEGQIQGKIKWVENPHISHTLDSLHKGDTYIFLAEKPHSEFVDLLPFARGFIFNRGSMLCHLAIVLREMNIPARIIEGSALHYKDEEIIDLP